MVNKIFFSIIFSSIIFSQDAIKVEFGNGTSNLSDFSMKIQDGNESFEIEVKRLRSNLRGLNFAIEEGYDNQFLNMLFNVISATGDGITVRNSGNEYFPTIELGRLSYSLNNWDINVSDGGLVGGPSLDAKININQFKVVPPRQFTRNLSEEEWKILKVFYQDGSFSIKKISFDINLSKERLFSLNAQIDLPVGKASIKSKLSIPVNFKGDPYIESTEINLTSLTPGLKEVIDQLLASSEEIPFKKKGSGYSLKFSGELNSLRFY